MVVEGAVVGWDGGVRALRDACMGWRQCLAGEPKD